jgi:glycosyltransferase involved in cell wall biosynthesis
LRLETFSGTPYHVAYFSPLPPARSGIADYSAELLPLLAKQVKLTLFVDDPAQVQASIARSFSLEAIADYPTLRHGFDLALYHIGNSRLHNQIYEMALRFPGVVVLHDYVLHHFIGERTAGQGDFSGYGRELAYNLGPEGIQLAEAIRRGWAVPPSNSVPLSERIADVSIGTIVHSQYISDKLAANGRQARIVPALITPFSGTSRRDELQLPGDAIIFGAFGQITPNRQIPELIQAFTRLRQDMPQCHLLLVGETHQVDLARLLDSTDSKQGVHPVGFVPDLQDFVDWIHTADVVVNLRNPTMGETSAIALRGMAASKPLIVNDHGWYSELPSTAVCHIPADDPQALLSAMRRLAVNPELRRAMGVSARDYVDDNCAPDRVADSYIEILREIIDGFMLGF